MALGLLQLSLIAVIVIQLTSSVDGEKISCEICGLPQQNSIKYDSDYYTMQQIAETIDCIIYHYKYYRHF